MIDTRREEDVLNLLEQLHRHVRPEGEAVYRKLERGFAEFTTEISTLKIAMNSPAIDKWREIGMTRQEGLILDALERAGARGLTRDGILATAYADKIDQPDLKTMDVMISKIRHKLSPTCGFHIETVWGTGYRLVQSPPPVNARFKRQFNAHKYQAEAA